MTLSKHRTFRTLFTIMQDMAMVFAPSPSVQSLRQKRVRASQAARQKDHGCRIPL